MPVLIGGYTAEMQGRATGITTYGPAEDDRHLAVVGRHVMASPSYLVAHPDRPWVFAVTEGDSSVVHCLAVAADGQLELLSSVESGGEFGCHLALSADLGHVLVAHYGSGSVGSFAIGDDGSLAAADLLRFEGTGPDPERQEGPHAHQVVVDGDELLVADLGTDRLHRLRLGGDGRLTTAGPPVRLPAGFGPRHLVLLGDRLVVVGELTPALWLGRRTADGWQHVHSLPTSAAPPGAVVQPSALRSDEEILVVANRGVDTVSVFRLDTDRSELSAVTEFATGGRWPRDLVLAPDRLWVANQGDDRVTTFDRTGPATFVPALEVAAPTPTCVLPLGDDRTVGGSRGPAIA